jgi:hypothetical protein
LAVAVEPEGGEGIVHAGDKVIPLLFRNSKHHGDAFGLRGPSVRAVLCGATAAGEYRKIDRKAFEERGTVFFSETPTLRLSRLSPRACQRHPNN